MLHTTCFSPPKKAWNW